MQTPLERNKENAIAFYDLMFNQSRPTQAIRDYVGDVYVQHNSVVGNGKKAFVDYYTKLAEDNPGKHMHFKRVIAEGSLVMLHCYQEMPGSKGIARIDIFRHDENGKIVEHWDVVQDIPQKCANNNSMF
jgi:predicted SnoaL-like aldol condensation-catalyzing enzyme